MSLTGYKCLVRVEKLMGGKKKLRGLVAFHTYSYEPYKIKKKKTLWAGKALLNRSKALSVCLFPAILWGAAIFLMWEPKSRLNRLLHFAFCKLHWSDWSWIRGQTGLGRNRYCIASGFPALLQTIKRHFALFRLNVISFPQRGDLFC